MSIILGISGGNMQTNHELNKYALSLTGKEHPTVLFIPTATHDPQEYIDYMENYYHELGCTYLSLCLCLNTYTKDEIRALFEEADVIYVGGGDTGFLLDKWKECHVDEVIAEFYHKDKVFTGVSAGTVYWFHYDFSDTDMFKNPDHWEYRYLECLDYFPYAFCPHYNEPDKAQFDSRVSEQRYSAIAMDNDTALEIRGRHAVVRTFDPSKKAYFFDAWRGFEKREFTEIDL